MYVGFGFFFKFLIDKDGRGCLLVCFNCMCLWFKICNKDFYFLDVVIIFCFVIKIFFIL